MKLLVAVLFVLAVVGFILWSFYERDRTTAKERVELSNLRAFHDRIRDHVLTQTEHDPTDPFTRLLLIEVHEVDRANATKELT
jgi:hypothetical protein